MDNGYMVCSRCWGHGVHLNGADEVADCYECGGSGIVRARDARGRFTKDRVSATVEALFATLDGKLAQYDVHPNLGGSNE